MLTRRINCMVFMRSLIVFGLITITSCFGGDNGDNPNSPKISLDLIFTLNPNNNTPLAGLLELSTQVPTQVILMLSDGNTTWSISFEEFGTHHLLTVLGLRPEKTHTIRVQAVDQEGNITAEDIIEVTTDPLPPKFPTIEVISQPDLMEPGVTLFSDFDEGLLIIVNEIGEVIWYYDDKNDFGRPIYGARRLSNGNLLFLESGFQIVEINMIGTVVLSWQTIFSELNTAIEIEFSHHEVFEMPSGNLLLLSSEVRAFDNYPTSETDPTAPVETANIVGDVIVEFSRDGAVLNEWKLIDLLDPYRIGYDSLDSLWDFVYPEAVGGTRDWSHGNAVIYDPNDDSIIVSVRHQDAVIKISRKTGELIWILGPHENWKTPFNRYLFNFPPGDDFEWPYHPHAPELTPDRTILLFDNGNFRASPFDPKVEDSNNYSRAVEYQIDEATMEINQIWEYRGLANETLFSQTMGDVDSLPETGNVLITFGDFSGDLKGISSARVVEVTHTTPAEKVFELNLSRDASSPLRVYRSERLEGLYP